MYDLLKDWPELGLLKQQNWNIDQYYDYDSKRFTFSFILSDLDDEIISINLECKDMYTRWYYSLNIDHFYAKSYALLCEGLKTLDIIKQKIKEIKVKLENKEIFEQV